METICGKNFPHERDLYNSEGICLKDCTFDGPEDGESALKESRNIILENCYMNLRYPLWHDKNVTLDNVTMTENCRAAIWYTDGITVKNSTLAGIKAVRECNGVTILSSKINSDEFCWKSENVSLWDVDQSGVYPYFMSKNLKFDKWNCSGKYSCQYVQNAEIIDSNLDTKDAFWHAKNVTVKNSTIKGEYLAWYSDSLTFINCKIIGTQPFCYCKNLKLVNCEMIDCDLSFEYSEVDADIKGTVLSVKNPLSGKIVADGYGDIILSDAVYSLNCEIIKR